MTPEGAVLKAVCDLLAAERIPFWRMNTGAVKTEKRFFRFGEKGMADVLAAPRVSFAYQMHMFGLAKHSPVTPMPTKIAPPPSDPDFWKGVLHCNWSPQMLWIECKAEKGWQTQQQRQFEEYVTMHCMSYIVVRTPEDLMQWLRDNGVKR